jgi:hypothetical protein
MTNRILKKIITLFVCIPAITFYGCIDRHNIYNKELHNVICEKYIEESNHYSKRLRITESNECTYVITTLNFRGLWEYAEVGDSVIKKPETYLLLVKKENGQSKDFEYTGGSLEFWE